MVQATGTAVDRLRRWSQRHRRRLKLGGFLLLILAAYIVPRVVAWRGVTMTSPKDFVDMQFHLLNTERLHKLHALDAQQQNDPLFKRFPDARRPANPDLWPHGVYHVSRLWIGSVGPFSIWNTQLTNLFFSLVLVAGVIALGRAMGEIRIGLWAALLTVVNPALMTATWYYTLDYPLAAMIIVGLVLLVQTRGFTRWPYCVALGLWSGLGLFVKLTYALYLLGPCVIALVIGLRASAGADGRRGLLRVVGLTLGAAALAAGVGMLLHPTELGKVWSLLRRHYVGNVLDGPFMHTLLEPWSLRWALAMVKFAAQKFPWPLLLLALPGLVLAHRRRGAPAQRWLVLGFFWWTYIALTLMTHKMERYLLPVYPVLCLLTAWWLLTKLPSHWRTIAAVWAVTLSCAVEWVVHRDPTTFEIRDCYARQERYMYELSTPQASYVEALRRNTYHPTRDLRPLVDTIASLLQQDRSLRPVGLAMIETPDLARLRTHPSVYHAIYLATAQLLRRRFLVGFEDEATEPVLKEVPTLVLIHSLATDPAGWAAKHRLVATRATTVTIEPDQHQVVARVSLLRYAGAE